MPSKAILISLAVIGVSAVAAGALYAARQEPDRRPRRRRRRQLAGVTFRDPADAADAKRQLQKLRKSLKKARDERADAERSSYAMGVKVADERIGELEAGEQHFQRWLATRGLGSPATRDVAPIIDEAYRAARADVEAAAQDVKHAARAGRAKLEAAERRIEGVRRAIEKAMPMDEGYDRDFDELYVEFEEDSGMSDFREDDGYQNVVHGAKELLKMGTQIERRRRRLVELAQR